MGLFQQGMAEAFARISSLDPDVVEAAAMTLRCSVSATAVAAALGIPAGVALGRARFPGRQAAMVVLQTLMAIPTVVVGLFLYGLLTRYGPFGDLDLLLTPWAIVLGEILLVLPIVVTLSASAVSDLDPAVAATAETLGAGWWRTSWAVIREARSGIAAAVVASFGRAIGEIGIAYMVGGNVRHYTRTLTTAIAMQTEQGEFGLGMALGIILLLMALAVNFAFHALRAKGAARD